jgi:CheY-like chemotaxis protein
MSIETAVVSGAEAMQPSTVLCLDDEPVLLRLLEVVLAKHGYVALPACTGHQALKLAAAHSFDAAILDYGLPDMTGGEVAREIRQMRPGTPILLFSGACDISPLDCQSVDVLVPKGEGVHALLAILHRLTHRAAGECITIRRVPRYALQLPFAVAAERSGKPQTLSGLSISIGEGGIGGTIEGELTPGEIVQISLSDSERGIMLDSRAQVCYRTSNRYGFAFLDGTGLDKDKLRRYCQQLAAA